MIRPLQGFSQLYTMVAWHKVVIHTTNTCVRVDYAFSMVPSIKRHKFKPLIFTVKEKHFLSYLQIYKEFESEILDLQLEKYGLSFDIKKCTTLCWALGDETAIGIRSFKLCSNLHVYDLCKSDNTSMYMTFVSLYLFYTSIRARHSQILSKISESFWLLEMLAQVGSSVCSEIFTELSVWNDCI